MKKPGIKIKIAGGTTSEHPKVSVITSLQVNKKLAQPSNTEAKSQLSKTVPPQPSSLIPQSGAKSKLNTAGSSSKTTADIPSPSQRFTSALNSANVSVQRSGSEQLAAESRDRSGSDVSSSNSENESSSGNESSSDDDSAGERTGGKTKQGKTVVFFHFVLFPFYATQRGRKTNP